MQAGGIPLLLRLLEVLPPSSEGASLAAEALALVAAVDVHRLGLVVRAAEVVAVAKRLAAGPDSTARYWALLLVNLLGAAEPPVLEEAQARGLMGLAGELLSLRPPLRETTDRPQDVGVRASVSPKAHQPVEDAAWRASQVLDAALVRVQAAWLVAHLSSLGPSQEEDTLLEGDVVRGLVRLLAEAVDAGTLAAASAGAAHGGGHAQGRRGAAAVEWSDGESNMDEVDSEW